MDPHKAIRRPRQEHRVRPAQRSDDAGRLHRTDHGTRRRVEKNKFGCGLCEDKGVGFCWMVLKSDGVPSGRPDSWRQRMEPKLQA